MGCAGNVLVWASSFRPKRELHLLSSNSETKRCGGSFAFSIECQESAFSAVVWRSLCVENLWEWCDLSLRLERDLDWHPLSLVESFLWIEECIFSSSSSGPQSWFVRESSHERLKCSAESGPVAWSCRLSVSLSGVGWSQKWSDGLKRWSKEVV